jgi:AraC-like DNA-binding protein
MVQAASLHDWGPASGFIMDMLLGAVLRLIESALGHLPADLTVDMPMPAPRWATQYERFAPVRIRFDQPALAFHASHALLRMPCLAADNHAHAAALRECESSMAESTSLRLSERVARLLSAPPGGRYPQLDEVATWCALTPRTLMRHLNAEGTSFKALLDASRQSQAIWMLQQTQRSVEDIAAQLGYQDTSNFSRTVRRWFGATPRQLRQSQTTCSEST